MLSFTVGGPECYYNERGVNGGMFEILFPINHGLLFYPGFDVLEPFIAYKAYGLSDERFQVISKELRELLQDLENEKPIPFRTQNGGYYDAQTLELKPNVMGPKGPGLKIHLKEQSE
ncbi:unnamed protein product [Ambrosiozyma monospora]|uniref:Unnamed protein product n=1 Tax=Ambrosiozyma monospora TaxID=43982 RepID=A0ACB5SUY0_AMBMO|nr:unnamed protein product [Ambrosiozyma monospora]